MFLEKRGIRGPKGEGGGVLEMELGEKSVESPEARRLFEKGECVSVFEGSGSGQVKMRSVGWFGTVVGIKEGKYLVRNRILAGKGSPALIEGEYLGLQKDFGLGLFSSGERTHYRTLSKRTRVRIEESVDRRNGWEVAKARKEIKKLKTKMTTETEAHRERSEKTAAQGKACVLQASEVHKEQMKFLEDKWSAAETKKAQQAREQKVGRANMVAAHKKQEVGQACIWCSSLS